ncbi:MAG: hypothetical protein IIY71_05245 [Oscillospiraceae bacterium]|nr:hypothetical protein [Oscillospiraceae bacterium]
MPEQVTNYKCPACTGPLHFVGSSGMLECDYCGSKYDISEIEALYAEKEKEAAAASAAAEEKEETASEGDQWDFSNAGGNWGAEEDKIKVYHCPSCGAELLCEETTAATSCPYCGNPTIVPGQLSGTLKPDYVIPFELDKQAAMEGLKKHYKGKKFLPKAFKQENHIEGIKGIYVPFWLFDGEADADMEFQATRSFIHMEGDDEVTTTEHFRVRRAGTVPFEKIPVDASSKMPDEHMDSIEPFDYEKLEPFSTAYLPGFLADKYDVSAEDSAHRADRRAENTAAAIMTASASVGYQTCIPIRQDIFLRRGGVKYALLPVWMLNTKWRGKEFLFAMNGQTGKMVGDLPMSWGRFFAWFGGIAAPLAAILSLIFHVL